MVLAASRHSVPLGTGARANVLVSLAPLPLAVVGTANGTVALACMRTESVLTVWAPSGGAPVNALAALALGGDELLVVAAAGDSAVHVTVLSTAGSGAAGSGAAGSGATGSDAAGSDQAAQRLSVRMAMPPKRTVEAVSLAMLPRSGAPALALGATDKRVYVYLGSARPSAGGPPTFMLAFSLHGHEDCVRALDWTVDAARGEAMLASGAKDSRVRLWRVCETRLGADAAPTAAAVSGAAELGSGGTGNGVQLESEPEPGSGSGEDEDEDATGADAPLVMRAQVVALPSRGLTVSVALEALLIAHEDWVTAVQWEPRAARSALAPLAAHAGRHQRLLSASMDRTLMLWAPAADGVWANTARFGDMGGNLLGFVAARWAPSGCAFVGASHQGALHMWVRAEPSATGAAADPTRDGDARAGPAADGVGTADAGQTDDTDDGLWVAALAPSGHAGPVRDIGWSHDGALLFSVSADQSARVMGEWALAPAPHAGAFFELGRPQIHGHDLNCLAVLPTVPCSFASGADEKMPRVFTAPRLALASIVATSGLAPVAPALAASLPIGANMPVLGLSNKAVADGEEGTRPAAPSSLIQAQFDSEAAVPFAAALCTEPPRETHLVQNTLWPEIRKLYGHGHEVHALAASPDGALLASACRATTRADAAIRLWRTSDWGEAAVLEAHTLTVVALAFSADSTRLLSGSRDRSWAVHVRRGDSFELVQIAQAHARIVWAASWTCDGLAFATGSRDKRVLVWREAVAPAGSSQPYAQVAELPLKAAAMAAPVTALAFALPLTFGAAVDAPRLAVGQETGAVSLWVGSPELSAWTLRHVVAPSHGPTMAVLRFAWRPPARDAPRRGARAVLAAAAEDHTVRVWNLDAVM